MEKTNGLVLVLMITTLLMATSLEAAPVCKQYPFIYRTSFEQGDGEGMETHTCKDSNFNKGDALFKKMQSLVNAGKPQEARKELEHALAVNDNVDFNKFRANEEICIRPAQSRSFENLMKDIGKRFSAEAENRGKLNDAISIDVSYCLYDDAARLHLIAAEKRHEDNSALKNARAFSKQYAEKSFLDKLLAIANKRSQDYIERDKKFFSAATYNPGFLGHAVDILTAVEDTAGINNTRKLAETRGDELARQNSCRILTVANEYYSIAQQDKKIAALKAKAQKIGADMEKQNNTAAAGLCYELSGNDSMADKMHQATEANMEKAEAAMQKKEPARKAKFTREQDDMEKELGL